MVFAETSVKVDAVVSVKWYRYINIYIYIYRLALYIVRCSLNRISEVQSSDPRSVKSLTEF